MPVETMDSVWPTALWKQFGAAIDMLDNALVACPDSLWRQPVWDDPSVPSWRVEFWYIGYHALVWLDLYLSGVQEEDFTPPAPFAGGELDSAEAPPAQTYRREDVRAYLAALRQKCCATIEAMTDERARQPIEYPWIAEQPISYLELQLYSLRHIQEHAAQLSLMLGQHGVPGDQIDWTPRAKDNRDEG